MTRRNIPLKATDVYNLTNNPFVGKTNEFTVAFPPIKSIKIQVSEYNYDEFLHCNYYTEGNLGEYINCTNPICYNGGFRVATLIRNMMFAKETSAQFEEDCQGYEGSPKGKRKYGYCDHKFKIVIEIVYIEEAK